MKILAYNSNLVFRTFGVPTHWDYDALGTFYAGSDAWNHNPGTQPIYFFTASVSSFNLQYKVNSETAASTVTLNEGNIIRMFGGDVFFKYSDGLLAEITELTKEPVSVTVNEAYNYDSETGRISTTPRSTSGWVSAAISVNAGDIVVYKGIGGTAVRLVGFQNADTCDVVVVSANTYGYNYYYKAPSAGTIYFNSTGNSYGVYVLRQP